MARSGCRDGSAAGRATGMGTAMCDRDGYRRNGGNDELRLGGGLLYVVDG